MAENRVTTAAFETLHSGSISTARVTSIALETLHSGSVSTARVTSLALEVLRSVSESAPVYGSGQPVIIITQ